MWEMSSRGWIQNMDTEPACRAPFCRKSHSWSPKSEVVEDFTEINSQAFQPIALIEYVHEISFHLQWRIYCILHQAS